MTNEETLQRIDMLETEIQELRTKIEPHGTGHIYTTISTLEHRLKELRESLGGPTTFLSENNNVKQ